VSDKLRNQMTFHGAVVILLGLLAGFPFAFVVLGSMKGDVRAWRMAHLEGVLNGLLVIAGASVLRRLSLTTKQRSLMAWSLIAMAYGNVVASIIGASTGVRGLSPEGPFANLLVYVLFMIAVVGVFVGVGLIAWGARPGRGGAGTKVDVSVSSAPAAGAATRPASSASRSASRSSASAAGGSSTGRSIPVETSVSVSAEPEPMSRSERRRAKKRKSNDDDDED
jgi:hypothetical protein